MTELEKIEYTKSFIDKLANGINPLDDSSIPEGELLNNVRISRCMFYVSDILRQVIENGGIKPQKKSKKAPFEITSEQLERFTYSDTPLSLTLKEVENDEGKKKKHPTEMGESLGISEELRHGMYGDYMVVIYNREAQQFVIDNLPSVIALKNK